jgi:hypothetical protein
MRARSRRSPAEHARLRAEATRAHGDTELVGASPALAKVAEQVALVAPTDAAVLVTGEPGTGKSLVARRIHGQSRRSAGPLVVIDCAATSSERIADRIPAAAGGTLVLEEACALPLASQDAFLDAFLRMPPTDVRLIATTSRDPAREIATGRLRRDLHDRVSVFALGLPPLRERPEDVAPLVAHFLRAAGARLGRPDLAISVRDVRALARAPWPGNVRELASTVERSALLAHDGRVRCDAPGLVLVQDVVRRRSCAVASARTSRPALARAGGRIYGVGRRCRAPRRAADDARVAREGARDRRGRPLAVEHGGQALLLLSERGPDLAPRVALDETRDLLAELLERLLARGAVRVGRVQQPVGDRRRSSACRSRARARADRCGARPRRRAPAAWPRAGAARRRPSRGRSGARRARPRPRRRR